MGVWASEESCVLESLSWTLPPFTNSDPIEKPTLHVGEFIGESFLRHAGPGPVFTYSSWSSQGVSVHQSSAVWVLSPCHEGCEELSVTCVYMASAGPEYLTVQTARRHLLLHSSHSGLK